MTNTGRSFCFSGVKRRQLIICRYVAKVYAIGLTSVLQLAFGRNRGALFTMLTLIRSAVKKDADVRLGVLFDSSGDQ
jgi:hypothetical protein